ncbi:MAG: sel1 repeat family protein [Marinobacter sp.]
MQSYRHALKTMALTVLIALAPHATTASASDDQLRVARDMIRTLEAYAVYKMGQYDQAFERYLALAEDGNRQGMLNVANMYSEGKGVAQSDSKAFGWYRSAAEVGDRIAMEQVARAYRMGKGVQESPERARYWEIRARAGD